MGSRTSRSTIDSPYLEDNRDPRGIYTVTLVNGENLTQKRPSYYRSADPCSRDIHMLFVRVAASAPCLTTLTMHSETDASKQNLIW